MTAHPRSPDMPTTPGAADAVMIPAGHVLVPAVALETLRKLSDAATPGRYYTVEPHERHAGAILVVDADNNDIAEFYHNEHATVPQSYESALALANDLCGKGGR